MGKWSELPRELASTIEELQELYIDKVRFRSVCSSWNSSYLQKLPNHQVKQLPWLLHVHDKSKGASHGILNLIESKIYHLDVPEAQGKMFKGSSHGWVATVEDDNTGTAIYLLNPLTRIRIKLPPRNKFPDVKNYRPNKVDNEYGLVGLNGHGIYYSDSPRVNTYFLSKIVLSSTPSKDDCVAVAIYGVQSFLAYCELKDNKWTSLHSHRKAFADVIFHKGKLHALTDGGCLLVFENIRANVESKQIATLTSRISSHLYLVESSDGGLIMVMRHTRVHPREGYDDSLYFPHKTYRFTIYKHDPINLSWVELKDLGDDMLFLGHNSSLSVYSRDFPGYKGNCIYFTDDLPSSHFKGIKGGQDIGVFNLENKSVVPLQGFECDPYHVWPPPVWVTPSPY